jgi:hypothetical protein
MHARKAVDVNTELAHFASSVSNPARPSAIQAPKSLTGGPPTSGKRHALMWDGSLAVAICPNPKTVADIPPLPDCTPGWSGSRGRWSGGKWRDVEFAGQDMCREKGYKVMCLKCRSARLRIRRVTGIERIVFFFTQKRKYLCPDCGFTFRAIDRRRDRRQADAYAVNRAPGHLHP